jgi:predicted nucleic acid-binding protein
MMLAGVVLVDTSFAVDALIASQRSHELCRAFLTRLAADECTLCFNALLEMELAETAFKIAVRDRQAGRTFREARHDGRVRRRAGRLMRDALAAWQETLAAFPFVRVGLEEVEAAVPDMMQRRGLKSYDAVHAATASFVNARAIVTLDTDFAVLPQRLAIYTTATRVAACRRIRSR